MGALDQLMSEVVYVSSFLARGVSCVVCSRADMLYRCLVVCPQEMRTQKDKSARISPPSPFHCPSLAAPPSSCWWTS
jgi:hypothetical protein